MKQNIYPVSGKNDTKIQIKYIVLKCRKIKLDFLI